MSFGQVTFVIEELPEYHDFEQSIYISGDFENWSGGNEAFKLKQQGEQYSITLDTEYCNLLFKFTLGSWSTVETNADGSATDNRSFRCGAGPETVKISIRGWTIPGSTGQPKSTATENVRVLSEAFEIPQLNRERRIWVYLPDDYDSSNKQYPVLYMHDGQNLFDASTAYAGEWNVDEIMNRIANDTGFEAIVVGVDNGSEFRFNEYIPWPHPRVIKPEGEAYVKFLVETLKPHIDKNFRTKSDPANTGIMGSSLGGLISHYATLSYPDVFGKAGVFSPSFWVSEQAYELAKEKSRLDNTRMYFLMGDRESEEAVPDMDRMISLMKSSGFNSGNIERMVVEGGQHNEKLWRDAFEEAILWLFEIEKPVLGNPDRVFKTLKQTDFGLEINVNDGKYFIRYYSPETVETTFVPEGEVFEKESHAVVSNARIPIDQITESTQAIAVFTAGINLNINKEPFQIAYSYKDEILLSEKKGYHKTDYGEAIQFNISQTEVLYGGGERALGMNRRGNRLQLYNKAHYGYEDYSPLMNFSMPIVISSKKYMVHFDNAPIGYLDLDSQMDNTLTYETISGRKTYQLIVGDRWPNLLENYTTLTGTQPIPPRWVFGNFSSRFGYHSQQEVENTIQKFKEEEIPVDGVILDIYWFGKDIQGHMGNLSWLRDSFPDPLNMINKFKDQGVKTTLITEPFILTTSRRWEEAVREDILAKDSQGNPYTYDFYFGNTGIIDIYSEKGRKWFWNIYKEIDEMGVDGVWGDLGEPEVHPSELIHATGTADEVHNIYGHDWARLVYEGYQRDIPNKRPFILMRAGYSGSQRFGLIPWSGDVNRSWGGLHPQVEIALQMGMQGMGYMHSDLGGFGGDNPDNELYTRWLQYGVFQPLFRPHAQEVVPSEPVYREEQAKQLAKQSIELRYRMLPYIYNLAFENNQTGIPFMRPLFYEDDDQKWFTNSTTYLWGNDFLVTPVIDPGVSEQKVYFPGSSKWFDFHTGELMQANDELVVKTKEVHIPAFVRAGAFIPLAKLVQTTDDYTFSDFELHYYHHNSVKQSERSFYNDDGLTPMAYEKGKYEILEFEAEHKKRCFEIELEAETGGQYQTSTKSVELVVHNIEKPVKRLKIGRKRSTTYEYEPESNILRIPVNWDTSREMEIKIKFK